MDVRAERQDLREIAALVIDLDDKERKEPKDAGYKCARHLLEAHRGEVHRAADYSIANGTINQDIIDRLLDVFASARLDKAVRECCDAISRTD